ncbi:SPW repeat protein [Streptomyces sp. HC44]|uniref:SPW repeat protein n=1 Tax=Streptomyces scabichelini TaxID=2711217 RepID=A0A6G4VIW8_9ACTN|nr:SPW repeat protein [Streptomyces scabichelini]NGO13825.1 SPW repeat protein [Streptomyces scabichelini]
MATGSSRIEEHPDLMTLRARYAEASASPIAQGIEVLSLLTGLYLAISPWIAGFSNLTNLTVNNLVTGLALTVLALGFGSVYERTYGMSWAAAAIGAWTVIAPWVISGEMDTTRTVTSNVIVGALALIMGVATSGLGRMRGGARPPV